MIFELYSHIVSLCKLLLCLDYKTSYKEMLPNLGGYLTDKTRIHLPRLELYFRELARYETPYFQRRGLEEENPTMGALDTYADEYYRCHGTWASS